MFDLSAASIEAILPFIAVGFAAQLVDGALGMAFGLINSTLLVSVMGLSPRVASASVHVVETFTTAAAIKFQSRRAADQIGPMLAGYYLCHNTREVTLDEAIEFISRHVWGGYLADDEGDDIRMFQFIISRMIDVAGPTGKHTVTIGTALEEARLEGDKKGPFTMALGARGIKVDSDMIGISDNAENTRALFKEMPKWSSDWKSTLRNIPGAIKSKDSERFAGGIKSRLTWIPYAHAMGNYVAREPGEDEE